ncbi:Sorbitol dehydrogenase 1 [Carabus blaptoides fortunei]
MAKDNLTAVLYDIEDMRLEQRPIPKIKTTEVLLRMECVGICGSDVHYLVNGRIGDFILTKPMVIGHEASGTVIEVGSEVTNLAVGDRVAIEPGVPCRTCTFCKEGRYNLCPGMQFCATPPYDGNLTRFYAHAADFCFKLPPHVSLEEGALLEPLSVGVHACKKAKIAIGSTVLILGAGPIGLVTLLAAKAMGASKVIITDIQEHRLSLARSLGADYSVKINIGDEDSMITDQITKMLGDQPTVSIDCSGAEQSIRVAIQATKSGGVAVMVGMGKPMANIPLISALAREVDIRGCFRYVNDYATALEMVATGKVNVKPLVTHHFTMEDTAKAFHVTRSGEGNPVKVMIHANPAWQK